MTPCGCVPTVSKPPLPTSRSSRCSPNRSDGDAVIQIIDAGAVLSATDNVEGESAIVEPDTSVGDRVRTITVEPIDEATFHVLTRTIETERGPQLYAVRGPIRCHHTELDDAGAQPRRRHPAVGPLRRHHQLDRRRPHPETRRDDPTRSRDNRRADLDRRIPVGDAAANSPASPPP